MKFSREPKFNKGPSLSEQVAEFITSEINKGSFQKGDHLPSESELSYRFNVSRTVIREALSRLKNDGTLETSQGRRTKVTRNNAKAHFRFKGLKQKPLETLTLMFEFHTILEVNAAALAAERRDKEDLTKLYRCLELLNIALQEGHEGTNANVEFHQSFINACRNPFIKDFISYLSDKFYEIIQADHSQPSNLPLTPDSYREHMAIYNAISDGDPKKARTAVLRHRMNAAKRRGLPVVDSEWPFSESIEYSAKGTFEKRQGLKTHGSQI